MLKSLISRSSLERSSIGGRSMNAGAGVAAMKALGPKTSGCPSDDMKDRSTIAADRRNFWTFQGKTACFTRSQMARKTV